MTGRALVVGNIPEKFNRAYAARDRENSATTYADDYRARVNLKNPRREASL